MAALLEAQMGGSALSRAHRISLVLLVLVLGLPTGGPVSASPAEPVPLVLVAHVDALIHPVSAEYMVETMDRADSEHAALLVFILETPGGLVDSTRTIVTKMLASKTPIAVFVAPSGARAASAGFLITIAADVAAMAPGTHIGAAHPVSGQGEKMDETMAKKVASDVAAYARTLASGRGRNVEWAEQAVRESRAFTEAEALKATPPLIDLVATDVPDLLKQLDGREIRRFDGRTEKLRTGGARVATTTMTFRQRVLSTLAHPNIAYILLSLGVLGLTIELWSPGAVLPGVAGGICLLLAFFTFQVLPVNYAGVLLILFGLGLLVLEIKIASFGLLGVGGIISLLLGSMILIDAPTPELRVSLGLIIPVVFALSAILVFLVRLAVVAQRRRSVTGAAGMTGESGTALTGIPAGGEGRVSAHGEIWTARAAEAIAAGDTVLISGIDGLVLTVRRRSAPEEHSSWNRS
jgi:membrane-bound serine protease (ClpP class)